MAIDPPGEASHSSTHSIDEPPPSRCNNRRNNIDYDSVTEHENIIDDDNNNNASANAADEWNSDPHHGFSSLSGSSSASASLPKFNSTSLVVVRNNNSPPSSSRGGSSSNNGHGAFEYSSGSNYDAQEEQQLVKWTTKKDNGNNNNVNDDDDELRHSERSGYTEKLSDFDADYAVGEGEDFDDDEDFDVCEERYRQPRDCSPPRPMDPDDYQMVPATAIAGPTAASTIINTTTTAIANSNNNNNNNNQLALPQQQQQQQQAAPPTLPKYNGYLHHFITVNDNHKFLLLYTFLQRHSTHTKIILFFSTPQTTRYHAKLLARLKFDVSVLLPAHHHDPRNRRHRQSSQYSKERLLETYLEFSNKRKESGILCLPDCMGKEFSIPPTTGWVVQFEPPEDPSEYIFRVGRVASEMGSRNTTSTTNDAAGNGNGAGNGGGGSNNTMMGGRALLFLTPKEFGFLDYYHATNTKIYEYELPKLANVQRNYERLLRKDDKLRRLAREAYFAYILQYASHEYRDVYNVHDLEEEMVALSFGFVEPPSRSSCSSSDVDGDGDYYCYEEEKEEDWDHYGREKRDGGGKGRVRESSSRQRRGREKQKTTWKPEKKHSSSKSKDGSSWMHGEKTWKHADRHASAMKTQSHKRGDVDDLKPSSIKFR